MEDGIGRGSRYASENEIFSEIFMQINQELLLLNGEFNLIDHTELNNKRFEWTGRITEKPSFYASRFWEYPFAIIEAELQQGMSCADIGCGTTPFTAYLAKTVGPKNVYAFDNDHLDNKQTSHFAFGVRDEFINKVGFNFVHSNIDEIKFEDNSFDRVFCLSVLEHIEKPEIWKKGLTEMARILKPGGRLIITFDTNIANPQILPVDMLIYTGLNPLISFNINLPTERFVRMENGYIDVFGIVLRKSDSMIELNSKVKSEINECTIQKNNIPVIYKESEMQILKDLRRKLGAWRIFLKLLLQKYK
ncbi:MAG: methyltransferase domain-containing protein [Salinivirgaceae bacterium]